jgi:hypothetical protein
MLVPRCRALPQDGKPKSVAARLLRPLAKPLSQSGKQPDGGADRAIAARLSMRPVRLRRVREVLRGLPHRGNRDAAGDSDPSDLVLAAAGSRRRLSRPLDVRPRRAAAIERPNAAYTFPPRLSVPAPRGRVTGSGGVGSRDAAVKPPWTDSRRPPLPATQPRKNPRTMEKRYNTMKLFKIRGGVHPEDRKGLSAEVAIEDLPLPPRLHIPLQQHVGAAAGPAVRRGERIAKGQLLATARARSRRPCMRRPPGASWESGAIRRRPSLCTRRCVTAGHCRARGCPS